MESRNTWGGRRAGAGRHQSPDLPMQRATISLSPADIAQLVEKGNGNASAGIRALADAYTRGVLGELGSGMAYTGTPEEALSVTLPAQTVVLLLNIGQGNVSAGVRRLIHAGEPKASAEVTQGGPRSTHSAPLPERQPDMAPANIARLQAARGGMFGRLLVRYLDSQGWYDEDPNWSPGDYDETDPDSWSESDWDTHIHQLVALMARMQ